MKTNIDKKRIIIEDVKSAIPDCIFELFIRLYYLNKNIRDKINNKSDISEDYYFVNYEFLKNIKMIYNYKKICEELEKFIYKDEFELELNINYLIKSIKQINIINEKVPLDNIPIISRIKNIFSQNHFVNFCLVNDKIIKAIQEIKKKYNLSYEVSSNKHAFYFKPQLFYTRKNQRFIKIGTLNSEDVFEMHYYISVDLTSSILTTLLYELRNSISVENFFKNRHIDIDKSLTHDLIDCFRKQGKVINFKYENQNNISEVNINNNQLINKVKIENENNEKYHNNMDNAQFLQISNQLKTNDNIKYSFQNPPLIGLQLIGNSPFYINSVFQCFCQIDKFANYFKYNDHIIKVINEYKNKNEFCLTSSMKKLVENLWPSKKKYIAQNYCHKNKNNNYFAPYDIIEEINIMTTTFCGNNISEPKDLINFIITKLNDELNLKKANYSLINNNISPNKFNQKEMLDFFVENFFGKNSSFISDNFYGTIQTKLKCSNCYITKYNYEAYSFIINNLDEINQHKSIIGKIGQQNNFITINDCFDFKLKTIILSGENAIPCDNCKLYCSNNYQPIFYTFPEILIMIFEKNKNSNIRVEIKENINLKNYIFEEKTGYKFNLIGIIYEIHGHYIADCRSPIDNLWYEYNNDYVSRKNDIENDINNSISLNILFYQKSK